MQTYTYAAPFVAADTESITTAVLGELGLDKYFESLPRQLDFTKLDYRAPDDWDAHLRGLIQAQPTPRPALTFHRVRMNTKKANARFNKAIEEDAQHLLSLAVSLAEVSEYALVHMHDGAETLLLVIDFTHSTLKVYYRRPKEGKQIIRMPKLMGLMKEIKDGDL